MYRSNAAAKCLDLAMAECRRIPAAQLQIYAPTGQPGCHFRNVGRSRCHTFYISWRKMGRINPRDPRYRCPRSARSKSYRPLSLSVTAQRVSYRVTNCALLLQVQAAQRPRPAPSLFQANGARAHADSGVGPSQPSGQARYAPSGAPHSNV